MLTMTKENIKMILSLNKIATLRPLRKNNKGYFKIGSEQQIKLKFIDNFYFFKVKIINIEFVDITKLKEDFFIKLGYKNKNEYMDEKFNKNNSSNLRICYTFKLLENTINYEKLEEYDLI